MDSEYTKEGDIHYFKEITCKNGDVYICLRKNKQIKKIIKPALEEQTGWEIYDSDDETKEIKVQLPKTGLPIKIVILRNIKTGENIRCFGTTNMSIKKNDILQKYRYRWLVENGIKDLVKSYYIDDIFGQDPEKIEFDFYCVMVARLAYEYFLKELDGGYFHNVDGNKYTLHRMRNLLFEKRNCTIEQDSSGDLILTILDGSDSSELDQKVSRMLYSLKERGLNKVLWWNNRSILLHTKNQY